MHNELSQPAPKRANRLVVLKRGQLPMHDEQHVLDEIIHVGCLHSRSNHPAAQQRQIRLDQPRPVRIVRRRAQAIEQAE
jgi:hypothetical protein